MTTIREVAEAAGVSMGTVSRALKSQLLRQRPQPDAVFVYNDCAALAAMQVCQDAGLRVPEDIAFVGFDDIPAASQGATPLTTLRVDKAALGRIGVELIMRGHEMAQENTVNVELVIRASTSAMSGA
jgi:LacI family repressor for deo operon, udp, cdd, tsx, nupC, and nupG